MFSIHIGQAGVQIADQFWQLQCVEYGICSDGLVTSIAADDDSSRGGDSRGRREQLFTQTRLNRFVPRALFVDTDDYVIDGIKRGERRQLYHRGRMLSGSSCDAASTYSRAQSIGRPLIRDTLDETRKMLEQCDRLNHLLLTRSLSGGTGSGLGSSLLQTFADEFPDVSLTDICLFPSTRYASVITEPYNAMFALNELSLGGMSMLFDNETLFNNCSDTKQGLALQRTSFNDVNRLLSECVSNLIMSTATTRISRSLYDIHRLMVRHSQMNLVTTNIAPLLPLDRIEHERLMFSDLTKHLFERRCATMSVDVDQSRIDNAFVVMRGVEDIDSQQQQHRQPSKLQIDQRINDAIEALNVDTVASPDAILNFVHLKHSPPPTTNVPRSATALVNGSAIVASLQRLMQNFDKLRSRRAFMHWYLADGVDAEDFDDAREQCCLLIDAYANRS